MIDIGSTSEALPYAATAVGAGIGVALEAITQRNIRQNQDSVAEVWGDVIEQQQPSGRLRKIARYVGGPVVAACALAGFANGMVWESDSAVREVPPALEIVVDHSGATALGDNPAAPEITHLVSQFEDEDSVQATAHIAVSGRVINKKPSQVAKNIPFGDAPLEQAAQTALDEAKLGSGRIKSANKKSSAVLVITNGNEVGASTDVVAQANSSDIPVFVVNVEADASDLQTAKDLQAIATGTNAKYWDANNKNIDEVSEDITKVLVPQDVHDKDTDSPWPKRAFAAALSILSVGIVYKKRSKMTLGNEIK